MRTQADPFYYAREGELLAGVDGSDIVVYDGQDEQPLWLQRASMPIVGLGMSGELVVSIDESGFVQRWRGRDGVLVSSLELIPEAEEGLCAFDHSETGVCVAGRGDGVFIEHRRGVRYFAIDGVRDLAFRDDGLAFAVGLSSGEVRLVDLMGHVYSATHFDDPIDSLCWSPRGAWLVSTGRSIYAWDGVTQRHCFSWDSRGKLRALTSSLRGGLFAFRAGSELVLIVDYDSGRSVGDVEYFGRRVGWLNFGPRLWLGIGLDRADGNRVDIATAAVHRTEPHRKKSHRTWTLAPRVDCDRAIAAEGISAEELDDPQPFTEPRTSASLLPAIGSLTPRDGGRIRCPQCASPVDTMICAYCGGITEEVHSPEAELLAVDDFHALLDRDVDGEALGRMLRGGFMPAREPALVEAGLRCVQILSMEGGKATQEPKSAAMARLEEVLRRLRRVSAPSAELRSDILELERRLEGAKKRSVRPLILGLSFLAAIFVCLAVLIWWFTKS